MIKNTAVRMKCVGIATVSARTNIRCLSIQSLRSGKGASSNLNLQESNPIVLPPEPIQPGSTPSTPHPLQSPVIEVPGPITEPILPQPQPNSKPPTEIPAPTKNAATDVNTQASMDDVLVKDVGDKGVVTLNRPKALNALNESMVEKIYPALKKWETSKKLVIMEGVGDKAFCAGGDVKAIALAIMDDNPFFGIHFFEKEYRLNHLIGTYKIPYVALINGVTMGGGVGLSVHGKYRVATESTLFAMPETAIGLFPDVGGSYFLPRLRGQLGLYLGLTGYRLKGIDVLLAGVATHYVPSQRLQELKQELLSSDVADVQNILNKYQPKDVQEFSLAPYMQQIEKHFSAPSVEEIIQRLKEDGSEWAENNVKTLLKMSPTSLKITMKSIQKGGTQSLAECLNMEYKMAIACMTKSRDFAEGVRALLIDKDQKPAWNPKTLGEVTDEYVDQYFTGSKQLCL